MVHHAPAPARFKRTREERIRRSRLLPKPEVRDDLISRTDAAILSGPDVLSSPRDSARRRMLALGDVTGIVLAYAMVMAFAPPPGPILERLPLIGALPLWIVLNKLLGLYDRDDKLINKSTLDELPKILHSVTLGSLLVFMFLPTLTDLEPGRQQLLLFCLGAMVAIPSMRAVARTSVRRRFELERCLIIGSGGVAQTVARKIAAHPEHGIELVGYVDDSRGARRRGGPDIPMLGDVNDFAKICEEHGIERVVVAFSAVAHEQMLDVIRIAKRARMKITIVPRLYEVIGQNVEVDEVEGMTMLTVRGFTRSHSSLLLKRAIDVVGAGLGLLVLMPILLAIAAAVKLTSRGPVFYGQVRMGSKSPFRMWKFRSMVVGADALKSELRHLNEADGVMFKITDDPRVTSVGRFLRRTSLDELPQLWNVVRGEMSLVGPRPLVPDEDDHVIGWHRARLDLTPGLTGPWQVAGRTSVPFPEMVKMDYLYVAEWSLWNDIRLLLRTAPVVLFARGC